MKSIRLAMSVVAAVVSCAGTALAADGGVVASAFSDEPFLIDTRSGGFPSSGVTNLTYSVLWHGDTNSFVVIAQDGVPVAGPV